MERIADERVGQIYEAAKQWGRWGPTISAGLSTC